MELAKADISVVVNNDLTTIVEFDIKQNIFNWDTLVDNIKTNTDLLTGLENDEVKVNRDPALYMFQFEGNTINTKNVVYLHCRNCYLKLLMEIHQLKQHLTLVEEEVEQP